MPEAAVHEDDCSISFEDDVRGAGQFAVIDPEPQSCAEEVTSHYQFGGSIAPSYT